jgi:hypothetical protein
MSSLDRTSGMDGAPLKEGAIGGFASFVVGYILTLLVVAVGESDELSNNSVEAAGLLYYNAQFASLDATAQVGGGSRTSSFNFLTDSTLFGATIEGPSVPAVVYHLIPILVLVAAGVLVANYVGAQELRDGAVAGATLALGTVLPALLGTVFFSFEITGLFASLTFTPALVPGVLLAGLFYPAVFGAIGGAISTEL